MLLYKKLLLMTFGTTLVLIQSVFVKFIPLSYIVRKLKHVLPSATTKFVLVEGSTCVNFKPVYL